AQGSGTAGVPRAVPLSLSLRGQTVDEALPEVDRYLDEAVLARLPQVTLIHGRGTGALRRAVRLLDAYINLTGHHGHRLERMRPRGGLPANIAASQFLRPWSRSWRWLEPLKERRIRQSLTWCAKRKLVYHLWWHPHNFGADIDENVGQLRRILEHFARLRDRYGMRSLTMAETADYADRELGR
ncbi:MAG: Smr/MutS family protein, partial [Bryobacteraceae bacterium]|nr:Smr/MutS family protein [Bryobacteraceae bacterium]